MCAHVRRFALEHQRERKIDLRHAPDNFQRIKEQNCTYSERTQFALAHSESVLIAKQEIALHESSERGHQTKAVCSTRRKACNLRID